MFIGWLSRHPKKHGRRASPFTHVYIEKYGEYVKYMRSIKNDVHVILDACISQQNGYGSKLGTPKLWMVNTQLD